MNQLDVIAIRILRRSIYDQLIAFALLLTILAAAGALF